MDNIEKINLSFKENSLIFLKLMLKNFLFLKKISNTPTKIPDISNFIS